MDDAVAGAITAAVDAGFDAQIEFTRPLVRYPSVRGPEGTAQARLHDAYRERDGRVERFATDVDAIAHHPGLSPVTVSDEDATNVVATRATSGLRRRRGAR